MDKRLHWLFCAIYIAITMVAWYAGYHVYRINGIYQGPIPEQATDELLRYVYHPLMGLLNIATVWALVAGTTLGCAIGMMDFMMRKSLKYNLMIMSIMLNVLWCMLYFLDWAHVIGHD
ncbi:hypothetical protein DERF_011845 [Dermatophagoides farinae]|uniref:Uncharacterized protein n=2 Tax=Dermatophagoides farinae TaxID=6954 RepID=A0A922HVP1_DERFA|nr:hypothetical protein HUG17_9903 [Dermatophagoides farinae]KAH9507147.1 hypothetical protein DERF_011845 [Dermatophagoides farinae]